MEVQKKPKPIDTAQDVFIPQQASDEDLYNFEPQLSEEDQALVNLHEELVKAYGDSAPMLSQLEGWKKRWGSISVSKVNADRKEFYVWRTLRRFEYKDMAKGGAMDDADTSNEMIVEKCLLYPAYDFTFRQQTDAGVITTLGTQISYKSGFVSPQEALSLIFIA